MYLRNILFLFITAAVLFSCNKDDEEITVIKEDPPKEDPLPIIDLKFYGDSVSSDNGYKIFKTSYGYISFGIYNQYYHNYSEGDSDIYILKLNEKLELIDETIVDVLTVDELSDVEMLSETSFVIAGRQKTDVNATNYFPYIFKINDKGERTEGITIGSAFSNNGSVSQIVIKDNNIYASTNFSNNTTSITKLDMDLNIIWGKEFAACRYSNLHVSDEIYYTYNLYNAGEYLYNKIVLNKLSISNGDEIYHKDISIGFNTPINAEFKMYSIKEKNGRLYLAGTTGREELAQNGLNQQGVVILFSKDSGEETQRLHFPAYWNIQDIEFDGDNLITAGWSFQSKILITKLDSNDTEVWEYLNENGNYNVRDIMINDDASITFVGSADKGIAPDRDVIVGMLNSDGTLK